MAPFVGNGTKVKIPSEIKPPIAILHRNLDKNDVIFKYIFQPQFQLVTYVLSYFSEVVKAVPGAVAVVVAVEKKKKGLSEPGVPWPPQILTDQLTLSQPGRQIIPTTLLPTPSDFQTFLQPLKKKKKLLTKMSQEWNQLKLPTAAPVGLPELV